MKEATDAPVLTESGLKTAARTPDQVSIMGVRITNYSFQEGIACLLELLEHRRSAVVFFCHCHTLNLVGRNPGFRDVLNRGDFVFGDGTGMRWAAKVRGVTLRGNLNGTDMIPVLLRTLGSRKFRYFMVGTKPESIEKAAKQAKQLFPEWVLAGFHHGYFNEKEGDRVAAMVKEADVDLLLVGMGSPLQENWILKNRAQFGSTVSISVGGLFNHWSGELRRAPPLVRKLGAEWVYLPIQQPHKWKRYLVGNFTFLWRMLPAARMERRQVVSSSHLS